MDGGVLGKIRHSQTLESFSSLGTVNTAEKVSVTQGNLEDVLTEYTQLSDRDRTPDPHRQNLSTTFVQKREKV